MRAAFLAVFLLAGVFSRLIYVADERHIGVLTMFLLSLLWIQRTWDGPTHLRYWRCVLTMLLLALSAHAIMGTYIAYKKLRVPYSQSRNAGRFLAAGDASTIVICEPDFFGDALTYYASNDIFIIRENRFGSYVRLRASLERVLTLAEISAVAEHVQEETGRPVLLALPARVAKLEEYVRRGDFGRRFQISADELQNFQERYHEVAAFDGEGSETFVFFELRNRPNAK